MRRLHFVRQGIVATILATAWTGIIPFTYATENPKPKVGLALSGGGARGIAHIGALRALEEADIPIDYISGTSMGAVIGSLYATGKKPDELRTTVDQVDWGAMFGGRADRKLTPIVRRLREQPSVLSVGYSFWNIELPPSAISDYWINRLLIEHLTEPNFLAGRDFADLSIPFRCVATDLRDGSRVVFADGDLAKAVRASMSIPGAFPTIKHGDKILVDGGLAENLPVRTVKEMGADFVIAIDISSPLKKPGEYEDLFGVISQMTDILMFERNEEFRDDADILVRPDLDEHSFTDYSNFQKLVDASYEATKTKLSEYEELVLAGERATELPKRESSPSSKERVEADEAATCLPSLDTSTPTPRQATTPPDRDLLVEGVQILGNGGVPIPLIERELQLEIGSVWNLESALLGMDRVFASGLVDGMHLDLKTIAEGLELTFEIREAPRRTFDLGLSYNDEDKAGASLSFNNRNLFGFGEQARFDFVANDRVQSMGVALWGQRFSGFPFAYDLLAEISDDQPRYFEDSEFVNRAKFDRRGLNFGALIPIRRTSLGRVGFQIERVSSKQTPGLPFPETLSTQLVAEVGFLSDTIDLPHSPRAGRRIEVTLERNFGEDENLQRYWRGQLTIQVATSLGNRHTLDLNAYAGLSENPLPLYELFRIGGPRDVPGLNRDELWGAQALSASVAHRFFLTDSLSWNTRVGAGGVFRDRDAISLGGIGVGVGFGFQYDTRIGPVSIDFGAHESGNTRIYFGAGFPLGRR